MHFWRPNLQTTKTAYLDDIDHAIRGQLPTTQLGASNAQILRKCQERHRTYKNQKLTNADLRTIHYSTQSAKRDHPQRTPTTIRGRRCSRRMAHSDFIGALGFKSLRFYKVSRALDLKSLRSYKFSKPLVSKAQGLIRFTETLRF